jgi:hypothetical protein
MMPSAPSLPTSAPGLALPKQQDVLTSAVTDAWLTRDQEGARVLRLQGFSGCHVLLIEHLDRVYVRKIAKDVDYNERLHRQAEKQKLFSGSETVYASARVYTVGVLPSGLAYFDMEYIPGASAAEIVATLPLSEIRHWAEILLRFTNEPVSGVVPPRFFLDKIASLRRDLSRMPGLQNETLAILEKLGQRSWAQIPQTSCHGDATLENMVVSNGRIHLIDFLDSFADSWYLDIAKLLQDLRGLWSFRHGPRDRNLLLRIAALRFRLEALLEERFPGCMPAILDLYALNLLRIIPYCNSTPELAYVEAQLAAVGPELSSNNPSPSITS